MTPLEPLKEHLGVGELVESTFRDNRRIHVPAEKIYPALECLRNVLGFDMLIDVVGIDYLHYPDATDRYGLVYALLNTSSGERIHVKTAVNDPKPAVRSAVPLWSAANWLEREVFDLFGIHFDGHPDLRRILLPEEFSAYPLRKDYPTKGRGERHNFPVITRAES